jgi:hypothetical protein
MEMALGGRPEDSAKIVCSRGCIAYLPRSPLKRQRNFYWPGDLKRRWQGSKSCSPIFAALPQDSCCRNPPTFRVGFGRRIKIKVFQILAGI